jgi:exodeoxyribonuclease-1
MTATYLFYDIETTGLNKAFDQVLQFAAVRADNEFSEMEQHTIRVKLRPDVIPSPRAIITNRISVAELTSGTCEFEAVQQIHQLLNEPGTISLGYNTLGFDDEFLRFSFYRNLLPPYTHQYRNGCRRMDLLPIAIIYWLYQKSILNWPQINGKPSLKLEHLSAANQLTSGPSHTALVDVCATIGLARIFLRKKKMWNYLEGYFEKTTDSVRVSELPETFQSPAGAHQMGLMVSSEYGPGQNYQIPVLSIGTSVPYSNQTLWLRLDLETLQETAADTVSDMTWVVRKRYGEPGIILPPLTRYLRYLSADRKAIVERNLEWLQSNPGLFQAIVTHHREYRYPYIPDIDPDAALYQIGFFSASDERRCREFLSKTPAEKTSLIDRFDSREARTLAARVLCRNYPEHAGMLTDDDYSAYMARVNAPTEKDALVDYKGEPRTTPPAALAEIKKLKRDVNLDNAQLSLLAELETYIKNTFVKKATGKQMTFDD